MGRPFSVLEHALDFDRSPPPLLSTGLRGLCPRCGRGHLFRGYLSVRPSCEACGLDFAFADSGDGPAFFVMSFVGVVVVALAMIVEFTYEPPLWLHAVLWIPFTLALSLALIRPLKGLLIAVQYARGAEQGRLRS